MRALVFARRRQFDGGRDALHFPFDIEAFPEFTELLGRAAFQFFFFCCVGDAFEELFYAAPAQFPSESGEGVGSGGYARGAWDAPWGRDGEVVNATRGFFMCLRLNGLEEEDCHVYIHTN